MDLTGAFVVTKPICVSLSMSDGKQMAVTIDCHGIITFGPGYTPNLL